MLSLFVIKHTCGNRMKDIDKNKKTLGFQMSELDELAFTQKAAQYGGKSYVLRELAKGFTQGRVKLLPPEKLPPLYFVDEAAEITPEQQ